MKKGFTLIELLVVIAIIALLLAILTPSLQKAKEAVKLAICASNQHQLILGLQSYSADNNGKLPPHPAERDNGSFSFITYLNYHQNPSAAQTNAKNEGTYYYLGAYLPEIDVYTCPLGPNKPSPDLQEQYVDYQTVQEGTNIGYDLYWGGYTLSDIGFVGPTGNDSSKKAAMLVISDAMNYWGPSGYSQWWISHKPRKGNVHQDQKVDPLYGNDCSLTWILEQEFDDPPVELKMNAGYIDGSVSRYTGAETIASGWFFIPRRWR